MCIIQSIIAIEEATDNAKEAIEAYLEANPNHITLQANQVCVREVQVNV